MAKTLKTSGIAATALAVWAPDDGVTTEFVSGVAVGSGITASGTISYGSSTWNGEACEYVQGGGGARLEHTTQIDCSLATGITLVFFCLGMEADATDARAVVIGGDFADDYDHIALGVNTDTGTPFLTNVNGTHNASTSFTMDGSTPFAVAAHLKNNDTPGWALYTAVPGDTSWTSRGSGTLGNVLYVTGSPPTEPNVNSLWSFLNVKGGTFNRPAKGKFSHGLALPGIVAMSSLNGLLVAPTAELFDSSGPAFKAAWARGSNALLMR